MLNIKTFWIFFIVIGAGLINTVNANHIVGGEFEIEHLGSNRYHIRLIQYRDALQQENVEYEPSIKPRIFGRNGNRKIEDIILTLDTISNVKYNGSECASGFLKTFKVVYSATVFLDPATYKDEGGYYIAWERCCRNNSISNIRQTAANTIGQTYYLEFPALKRNGQSFTNSTPSGFPALADYACVNEPFSANFAGEDKDGDELVYSLATPLDSSTDEPVPDVSTAPHPKVRWKSGFEDIIPGNPSLGISSDGILTVTPKHMGLYVFSVRVEEFRMGVKIGEVRRDFQLYVVDCRPQGTAPKISIEVPKGIYDPVKSEAFIPNENQEEEKCVDIYIKNKTDVRSNGLVINPVNFSNVGGDNAPVYTITPHADSSKDQIGFSVCFDPCRPSPIPYLLDVIATNNGCPTAKTDSMRVVVDIGELINSAPYFIAQDGVIETSSYGGDIFELPLEVRDEDGDIIEISMIPVGFDTTGLGMQLQELQSSTGYLKGAYSWDLNCELFDFTQENKFTFQFVATEVNYCELGGADTLKLILNVEDIPADYDAFEMPNVFTPNGDGKNDFFQSCLSNDCDPSFRLPPDNCQGRFEEVLIHNRWGRAVFRSSDRAFRWNGDDLPPGTYYYVLRYSHREFKGSLSILR